MSNAPPPPDRIWELLAERATQGLSEADARELAQLCRDNPEVDPLAFEAAAAAISLSQTKPEPMPEALRAKLMDSARSWTAAQRSTTEQRPDQDIAPIAMIGRRRGVLYAGWAAAAASLVFAIIGWWTNIKPSLPLAEQRNLLVRAGGVLKLNWQEWKSDGQGAEIKGVSGDVVWDEKQQKGFMRFSGLPANDPSKEQYQLWIVDERGMNQRISGAIFDIKPGGSTGEVVVPITPLIHTRGAAAFALTIEKPGGTWVSSMERRVVIAMTPKG